MWSKTNLTSQQENNRMKNGEYAVEEKKVATDREYTVWEILQGNLKVWWLMLFGAAAQFGIFFTLGLQILLEPFFCF